MSPYKVTKPGSTRATASLVRGRTGAASRPSPVLTDSADGSTGNLYTTSSNTDRKKRPVQAARRGVGGRRTPTPMAAISRTGVLRDMAPEDTTSSSDMPRRAPSVESTESRKTGQRVATVSRDAGPRLVDWDPPRRAPSVKRTARKSGSNTAASRTVAEPGDMSDGGLGPEATALRFYQSLAALRGAAWLPLHQRDPVADSRAASAGGKAHESLIDEFSEAD